MRDRAPYWHMVWYKIQVSIGLFRKEKIVGAAIPNH